MYLTVYEQLTWLTLGDSTQGRTRIMLIFNELRPRGFRLPRQAVQASSPNGADSPGNWRRPDFIMGAGASRTHEWQKSVVGSGTILEPAPLG